MNDEKLSKANQLKSDMDYIKPDIKRLNYTQNKGVVERVSYLTFNGVDGKVEIPKELFKKIGKIVLTELKNNLKKIETEFNNL